MSDDPRRAAFRGTHAAAGLLLDVALVGEHEARVRVLRLWTAGARLRSLPDGQWLLLFATTVAMRAERAPGLLVYGDGRGALSCAGAQAAHPGTLTLLRHDRAQTHRVTDLPAVDPATWIDVGALPIARLEVLDRPPAPTTVIIPGGAEAVDLRELAKVTEPSAAAARAALDLRGPVAPPPAAVAPTRAPRNLLARLVLKSPAGDVIARRHGRYLAELTRSFERHDYGEALRNAIALTSATSGRLSLRLPPPRLGRLGPTLRRPAGAGSSVPWGPSVREQLTTLYRQAAERLEQEGQIEQAAFVYADLLQAPRDAVTLLERHGRLRLAAQLADGRELEPELAVRLWWQAGDRVRATDLARARGAWAAAIERLQTTSPAAATELRAAWVAAAQRAGDHRTAVSVAWPDELLRGLVSKDLAALRERHGASAAWALARQLAWRPDDAALADAVALVTDRTPAAAAVRGAFAQELSEVAAADPAADRQLTALALRAVLRDAGLPGALAGGQGSATVRSRLRRRTDPLLRADLPALPATRDASAVPLLPARPGPGTLGICDAVLLDHGVLVAAGERGLHLLAADGRPRARWDVPADALCVADHGSVVLVIGYGETLADVHRLDLTTRRLDRWASLAHTRLMPSFDGGVVAALDRDGLVGLDVFGSTPRELWRELDRDTRVVDMQRSPHTMSVIVDTPLHGSRGERSLERWTWDIPGRRLARRELAQGDWDEAVRVTASGVVLWCTGEGPESQEHRFVNRLLRSSPVPDGAGISISGDVSGLVDPVGPRMSLRFDDQVRAVVEVPGAAGALGLRVHGTVATVWAPDGRVVAVDLLTRTQVATLTTTG